ncbi:MAG TPA: aminopeptidase [Patescibacteria group bacterium]|nr:aminopeptidase [Patescibacteria group bacterium]
MKDLRCEKLASVLLNHSLKVKAGENLIIRSNANGKPLVDELYKQAVKAGLNVFTHVLINEHSKFFMENATEEQFENANIFLEAAYEKADAFVVIEAPDNVKHLSKVDSDRNMKYNKAVSPLIRKITDKRWVMTNFPTHSFAQEADMSLEEYENMLFDATLVDYQQMDREMDKIIDIFDQAETVRIVGKDTDLTFSIKGRKGIKCSGANNIPDGEVFYAPVTDSANGHIYYEFPAIRYGVQVDGIRLEFKDGKVVKATADKNEEFLNKMLDTDAGARFLGEFGIGLNYGIQKFIKNILFDEKIGGTIHLAVGNAYEESGGENRSIVHWDMIKELREGGEIYVDGRLVQKNGTFI